MSSGYPCPKFKLIVLDECDSMTADAQSALRRVIENYSRVTRFCLICNYVTRIIEPLASRCAKFRFKTLPAEAMIGRLRHIASLEHVGCAAGSLEKIMDVSGGDMRRAVTFLQSCAQLSGTGVDSAMDTLSAASAPEITVDIVIDISGEIPAHVIGKLWGSVASNSFDVMQRNVDDLIAMGYPLNSLLSQLHDHVVGKDSGLKDLDKALICEKIAQAEQHLIDGASEALQLLDVSAYIMRRLTGQVVEGVMSH
jgi:replication factor C subunit 2/4